MTEDETSLPAGMKPAHGTVLYVEDNPANITVMEAVLDRLPDVTLVTTMQGALALPMAREHGPDLIVLDLHLPDLEGSEVLRQLKQDSSTRNIPVVMLSAEASPKQVDELTALGAMAHLTKPLNVKVFLALVTDTLAGRHGATDSGDRT